MFRSSTDSWKLVKAYSFDFDPHAETARLTVTAGRSDSETFTYTRDELPVFFGLLDMFRHHTRCEFQPGENASFRVQDQKPGTRR